MKGAWGTVCDTNFDIHDANVVCRQLGYGKALVVASYPLFGVGTGRIWLDTMNCRGDEQHIGDCQHGQWGLTSCSHSTDNSAICGGEWNQYKLPIVLYTIREKNGTDVVGTAIIL